MERSIPREEKARFTSKVDTDALVENGHDPIGRNEQKRGQGNLEHAQDRS